MPYGLDDDLRTGLVFYGRDLSEVGTIFYRPVVADRLEMYFSCERTIFSDPSAGLYTDAAGLYCSS